MDKREANKRLYNFFKNKKEGATWPELQNNFTTTPVIFKELWPKAINEKKIIERDGKFYLNKK